jgi:hypothetical protein
MRSRFGSSTQAECPTIACFNKAITPLGVDFDALIAALQVYVDKHVAPVWGTPAKLVKTKGFRKGAWALVFLEKADSPGDEAYHDLTPDGLPEAKVFVKSTLKNRDLVSVSASHELVEMLVDPATNMMTTGPHARRMYAYESADPVEDLSFKVNGILMSNFVYPAYFEDFHKRGSMQFDHMKKVKEPFELLPNGYQSVFRNNKWSEMWGSTRKEKRFKKEDRRGHRSELRKKRTLKPADLAAIKRFEAKAGK